MSDSHQKERQKPMNQEKREPQAMDTVQHSGVDHQHHEEPSSQFMEHNHQQKSFSQRLSNNFVGGGMGNDMKSLQMLIPADKCGMVIGRGGVHRVVDIPVMVSLPAL